MITNIASPIVRSLIDVLELVNLSPRRVLANISNTQKDTITSQLNIGIRFFDMRPGWCFHDVIHTKRDLMHHQHAIVPGCTYEDFLTQIFDFLATHPSEIVVVELKDDGFVIREDRFREDKLVVHNMVPSVEELEKEMQHARDAAKEPGAKEIVVAGPADMNKTIGQLIQEKRRLILIDRVHNPEAWARNDSYGEPLTLCLEWCHLALTGLIARPRGVQHGRPSSNHRRAREMSRRVFQLQFGHESGRASAARLHLPAASDADSQPV